MDDFNDAIFDEPPRPMTAAILNELRDAGCITPKQLGVILGIDETSAYRYFNATELRLHQVRAVIREGGRAAQQAFLLYLFGGTPWCFTYAAGGAELDFDHDGKVDFFDMIGHHNEAVRNAVSFLEHVAEQKGDIDADRLRRANEVITEAKLCMDRAAAVMQVLHARKPARKKCRPATSHQPPATK